MSLSNKDHDGEHQFRVWLTDEMYSIIREQAAANAISQAEQLRRFLAAGIGQHVVQQAAPWLESLLDAILSKYFADLPPVLDRLVFGAIETRQWFTATMAKLIELTGDRDRANQDRRVKAALDQITAYTRAQTDEFFATIGQDAFIPEPSPDGALPEDA